MKDQISALQRGDTIALMHTNMGDITFKLFPKEAPKAVENFTTHAQNGYYDGLSFHRIISGFMIQGGDPTGTGAGGESIWGESFKDECCVERHNYRGALSMANAGPNTNGSQFFIVHSNGVSDSMLEQMKDIPDSFPPEVAEIYENRGGTPWLDFKHTVFGQTADGFDIVEAIATVPTDGRDRPLEPVIINSIEISIV